MGIALVLAMLMAAPDVATVGKPVVNMYSRASLEADVVSQSIYGVAVSVVAREGGWARIRTPDAYQGWVTADSLAPGAYNIDGRTAEVVSLFAHLYQEPSVTKHQPLLTVPFETRLVVKAEPEQDQRRWIQVRLVDGRAAWVQRGDVSFDARPLTVAESLAVGKRFLGLPYTWGGTSSYGYDCSGLTQMICRRRGITLPRDAGPQARWERMTPVTREQLQPGDLLYFGSSMEKITHTGTYLGNGEFLHATTHDRPVVQISRLDDPYWTRLLVCARRVK